MEWNGYTDLIYYHGLYLSCQKLYLDKITVWLQTVSLDGRPLVAAHFSSDRLMDLHGTTLKFMNPSREINIQSWIVNLRKIKTYSFSFNLQHQKKYSQYV